MKCPFCKSENIKRLSSLEYIKEKVVKSPIDEVERYTISKGICLDCGYVFQKMDDDVLKQYHEDESYFVN